MKFNFKLHRLMWQNLARNPSYNKETIIELMYDNQDITFEEKLILKNSTNMCLACQFAIDTIKQLNLCPEFEKPHLMCCYCPFKTKNQSSEECLEGLYQDYLKHRKIYIDLCTNISDRFKRADVLQHLKSAALRIANYPLKKHIEIEDRYGL